MKARMKLHALLISAVALLMAYPTAAQNATRSRVTTTVTDFEPTEPLIQASDAFERLELFALDVRRDAATLKSFLREPTAFSPRSHASRLTRIRESVNNIADEVERLERLEPSFLPRQELAFNHIQPHLAVLVDSTSKAIDYLNTYTGIPWSTDYETYVTEIYDRADGIVQAADMAESRLNVQAYLAGRDSED